MESEITLLQEEIKQDPSNFDKMKKLENFQKQLKEMIASRRFKLTANKYYCTFYKSDINPPDKRPKRKNESRRNEKKQKIVMMQIPVNLNDATTAHKLQGVTKNTSLFTIGPTHMAGFTQCCQEYAPEMDCF